MAGLLIINNKGKILAHKTSVKFEQDYGIRWLRAISKKVFIRFKIKNFHKEMDDLKLTINVFKKYIMVVGSISPNYILIMIVPSDDGIVPGWIKKNAHWWSEDLIHRDNFVKGLQ